MAISEVLRYLRETNQKPVLPEILGLPSTSESADIGLVRSGPLLVEALMTGDEVLARQVVFDLFLAKHSLSEIFDTVIAVAFREIGVRWACQLAEVYQERRACEIAQHVLFDLRRVQQVHEGNKRAIGGTIEGDHYALSSAMAELVLRDTGFSTTSLGTSIPFASLIEAIRQTKPDLFWLSVSHIRDGIDFIAEFARMSQACHSTGTALAVGGRALTDELRSRMKYSAFCDTMQHLEAFATIIVAQRT